jgi:protein TonB
VNTLYPSKKRRGRLAFTLSCLLHIAVGVLIFLAARRCTANQWLSAGPKADNTGVIRIELQSLAAAPAPPEAPRPAPKPPAPAEVPLKETPKPPEPAPAPEPVVTKPAEASEAQGAAKTQTAQVTQQASAPGAQIEAAEPLAGSGRIGEIDWRMLAVAKLRALIEREKYYPVAARKAGYTGRVSVRIRLEKDGTISGGEIAERQGHPLLGRAVETTLGKLQGGNIGLSIPEKFDVLVPIDFELN